MVECGFQPLSQKLSGVLNSKTTKKSLIRQNPVFPAQSAMQDSKLLCWLESAIAYLDGSQLASYIKLGIRMKLSS